MTERARSSLVGTFERDEDGFEFVVPDDGRLPPWFGVNRPKGTASLRANVRDKVVLRISEYGDSKTPPFGVIQAVLGPAEDKSVDVLSVIYDCGLPLHFPDDVLAEAEAISEVVKPEELVGRVDCRGHNVINIDPDDAKDFDDAIYVEKLDTGWKLWVHVADVSHYVKPEALSIGRRGSEAILPISSIESSPCFPSASARASVHYSLTRTGLRGASNS